MAIQWKIGSAPPTGTYNLGKPEIISKVENGETQQSHLPSINQADR
jgi:hypothetical protein